MCVQFWAGKVNRAVGDRSGRLSNSTQYKGRDILRKWNLPQYERFCIAFWHLHLSKSFSNSTKDVHSGCLKTKHKSSLVSCNSSNDTLSIINNLLAKFSQEARELHQLTASTMHAILKSKLLGPRDHQTGIRLQWSGYRDFRPQRQFLGRFQG